MSHEPSYLQLNVSLMSKLMPPLMAGATLQAASQKAAPEKRRNHAFLFKTNKPSTTITELAKTATLSIVATATMVGAHHYYRRQHSPDARLMDYLQGAQDKVVRLRQGYQAGRRAFIDAYHAPHDDKIHNELEVKTSKAQGTNTDVGFEPSNPQSAVRWVSGVAALADGGFGVTGIDKAGDIVWQTPMPERVHDIVVQPEPTSHQDIREVVVMGRRPSERFWVLDTVTGEIRHAIKAQVNRHFYGHACYSLDGRYLYVTENDTDTLAGKIGVYDSAKSYQKVKEFDSFGIGPHELVMHPDAETLIIANGGIKTEKASREELNLDTMRPSLVYLNRHDGQLLEQILPEHNQMSVRHLDIHRDGRVMIGIQFQGARHINVPLVLTHQRGDAEFIPLKMPNNEWQCFHQYIASVAVDSEHNLLCVTSPIGGCAVVYDLDSYELIDRVSLPDCAGAAVIQMGDNSPSVQVSSTNHHKKNSQQSKAVEVGDDNDSDKVIGFIVSDGQGSLTTLKLHPNQATMTYSKENSCVTNTVENFKPNPLSNRWQVETDPRYHKMSFDNHLQVL